MNSDDEKKAEREENKKLRFARVALKYLSIYLVIFSMAQFVSFMITGEEQVTLTEWTFRVAGIEAGGLLLKRIVEGAGKVIEKIKTKNRQEIDEDHME